MIKIQPYHTTLVFVSPRMPTQKPHSLSTHIHTLFSSLANYWSVKDNTFLSFFLSLFLLKLKIFHTSKESQLRFAFHVPPTKIPKHLWFLLKYPDWTCLRYERTCTQNTGTHQLCEAETHSGLSHTWHEKRMDVHMPALSPFPNTKFTYLLTQSCPTCFRLSGCADAKSYVIPCCW